MTNAAQNEFINEIDGDLTPEEVAQLLGLGEGDTDASAPEDGVPDTMTDSDGKTGKIDASEPDTNDKLKAETPVLMAKDGIHTIGYEKLVEAREAEKQWRSQAEAAQRELEGLKAQAQARADAGAAPTKADNQVAVAEAAIATGVDPDLFGDFSEEALSAGISKLVGQQVEARLQQALAPFQQKQADEQTSSHFSAIYEAHPDADSIAESKELAEWIASQPSYARPGIQHVFADGSTQEVIEVFDRFKQATGATQAKPTAKADVQAKAQAAIARTAPPIPSSLSDFPGGRAGAGSRDEALAAMDGMQLVEAMETMTDDQIAYYLNKL